MSLKSLEQGKLLGFFNWIDKNLRQLTANRKLNLLTTKLRGAFAYVLACVRKNFLVKSTNCVSVRVQKTKISDKK